MHDRDKGSSRIFFEGSPMLNHLLRLYRDDQAATAVEYAVLLALILVAVISAINAVGNTSSVIWANDANKINTATGGS